MDQRTRVMLLVVAAALPLLVLASVLLVRDSRAAEDRVASDHLVLARAAASHASMFIERNLDVLRSIAVEFEGADPAAIEWIESRLDDFAGANPKWFGAALVNEEGHALAGTPAEAGDAYVGDRAYFQEAIDSDEPAVSSAVIGRVSELPSVNMAVPLTLAGGEPGVLVASFPVSGLHQTLRETLVTDVRRIVVVDPAGRIFIHPDPERMHRLDDIGDLPGAEETLAGGSGTTVATFEGEERVVAYAPVEETGWTVFTAEPTRTAFAPVRQALQQGIAFMGATFLGILGLGWYVGGRLSRSYERLDRARIEAGEAREEAEAVHQRYVDLVDGVDAIVWEADARTLTFHYVSQRAVEILGFPISRWLMEPDFWIQHAHPEDRDAVMRYGVEVARQGYDHTFEYRAIAPDGRIVWLAVVIRVGRAADGSAETLRGIMIDVTERHEADEERTRLLHAEHAAREHAEQAVRSRDEFLSIASHELRNPVTGIKGTAQLMQRMAARGALTDDATRAYVATIVRTSDRLARLVEDLLDVARLQSGRFDLRTGSVDLAALVRETVGETVSTDRHQLITHDAEGPRPVRVDADRIRQVLQNLIENAVKYSPGGGPVAIGLARTADGGAMVTVRDQGIGLPPGAAHQLFQPFGRAENAAEANIEGMGLGLYICRRIAHAHGGELSVESEGEGRGSTFTLWLPASAVIADDDHHPAPDANGRAAEQPARGRSGIAEP